MEFYREVNLMEFSEDLILTARYYIKKIDTDLARRKPANEKEALHKKRECYLRIINVVNQLQEALTSLQGV